MDLSFYPSGDCYLSVDLPNVMSLKTTLQALTLESLIQKAAIPGIRETVATWHSILVHFDPMLLTPSAVEEEISRLARDASGHTISMPSRIVEIPVHYGGRWGSDIGFVAEVNGISEAEVIERHSGSLHLVGMISFTPGQANCMFLDRSKILTAPKYEEPRTYTPEGIVGLGGTSTAIYSVAAAGGFQMIGYTPVPTYDPWCRLPQLEEPVVLRVADQLKFVPINEDQLAEISQQVREARYNFTIEETVLDGDH